MKVLVNEIEKETLCEIKKYFVKDFEITILDYASEEYISHDCRKPYYIEENIENIDAVLQLCEDVSYDRTPIRYQVGWNDFCLFWALIFSIYKQRKIGRKIDNLKYLYEIYKDKYNIKLTNSLSLGKEFTDDFDIIYGVSKLGEIFLYMDDIYFDFVCFAYFEKDCILYNKFTNHMAHWHPQNFFEAGDNLNDFMSNDESFLN